MAIEGLHSHLFPTGSRPLRVAKHLTTWLPLAGETVKLCTKTNDCLLKRLITEYLLNEHYFYTLEHDHDGNI